MNLDFSIIVYYMLSVLCIICTNCVLWLARPMTTYRYFVKAKFDNSGVA